MSLTENIAKLPQLCYAVNGVTEKVISIKLGESGYHETSIVTSGREESQRMVDYFNGRLGVTPAQRDAMYAGSMFGYHVPAANPDNYDENGTLKVPAKRKKHRREG